MALVDSLPDSIRARKVIMASNRGPFEYSVSDGEITFRRGLGGLVTALTATADLMKATWVAMAMSDGDRRAMAHLNAIHGPRFYMPCGDHDIKIRQVAIPEHSYAQHYVKISSELLWFTFHHMHELATRLTPEHVAMEAWTNGFRVANQAIANAVSEEIGSDAPSTVLMIQDCFLFLVPGLIRRRFPSVIMQHFLHWPWPDPRYLSLLPSYITTSIYSSLLANDIIGLQTDLDVRNFLDGASVLLDDAEADYDSRTVTWRGHHVLVRAYPVSISVKDEHAIVESQAGLAELQKLEPYLGKKVVMRVDRLDPIKNVIPGFYAFAKMIDDHPELREEVVFLAFLVPTRESAPSYQQYARDVRRVIHKINQQYSTPNWQPVQAFVGNNRTRALAALQEFDVLLVSPRIEGMNLVSKEGAVLNRRNGVLVLSRSAGSFHQLRHACLPICSTDTNEIARALYQALVLPKDERAALAAQAREETERHDLYEWLERQIQDINQLVSSD
jgi:trehalose 6-phosphate synthase